MKTLLTLEDIRPDDHAAVGGKAAATAVLAQNGIVVPETVCVPAPVYDAYLDRTGLRERILLELNRKDFARMRWEEIWDSALRIRNMFLTTPLPNEMAKPLQKAFSERFSNHPVAVRSSGLGEDGSQASFAGMHESFMNVQGAADILVHVRLVWASLWSDAALLYRQELKLDVTESAMAVVIQQLLVGSASGIFFSVSPNDAEQAVIEAVYGLNQGLVDGDIAPDRWLIDRKTQRILTHTEAERTHQMLPSSNGVAQQALPPELTGQAPLTLQQLTQVISAGFQAEHIFGCPQDVEWTFDGDRLVVLQSRPITSAAIADSDDQRVWYLSLHRSFDNLTALKDQIVGQLIPEMIAVGDQMAALDLNPLTDAELADEIVRRKAQNDQWVGIYWAEFIPFAHGIRLFGQFYNDAVRPEDPYEFMQLLEKTNLKSTERNRLLDEMAQYLRRDPALRERITQGHLPDADTPLAKQLDAFIAQFGDLTCSVSGSSQCRQGEDAVLKLVLEFSRKPARPPATDKAESIQTLQQRFLDGFDDPEQRRQAQAFLELGRTAYQLRDDDNIYLGRIEAQLFAAMRLGQERLADADNRKMTESVRTQLTELLAGFESQQSASARPSSRPKASPPATQARQLVGQPAGPGLASGPARVIHHHDDLLDFQSGEVLICDAVDPNMTFVAPLAQAVVERRGGMLIHGAIIAREYGIACVTGVPDVTALIQTGDRVTVDGYLGIVTIGTEKID